MFPLIGIADYRKVKSAFNQTNMSLSKYKIPSLAGKLEDQAKEKVAEVVEKKVRKSKKK